LTVGRLPFLTSHCLKIVPSVDDEISLLSLDADSNTKDSTHDTVVFLPDISAANHVNPVKGTRAARRWTPVEDASLNSTVTNPCKKEYGKKNRMDSAAVTELVAGRVERQCRSRWKYDLDPDTPTDRMDGWMYWAT
jgi:hypothetical protein